MRILPILALTLGLAACKTEPAAEAPAAPIAAVSGFDSYGDAIADTTDARAAEAVTAEGAALDGQTVKVAGTLRNVCQMAGCWATIETPTGNIRITVPKKADGTYAWTMPKDIAGRRVVATGTLKQTTLDAEKAEHMAKESGQAGADSTEFKDTPELQLEATGVLVEKAG